MIELATNICVVWLIAAIPTSIFIWWRFKGMKDVTTGNVREE